MHRSPMYIVPIEEEEDEDGETCSCGALASVAVGLEGSHWTVLCSTCFDELKRLVNECPSKNQTPRN